MNDTVIDSLCINPDECNGTVTLRLWTDNHPPHDRRRDTSHLSQVALVSQTCACTLSEDAIERLGIFARSRRRPFPAD
jgi:hypothetical protein